MVSKLCTGYKAISRKVVGKNVHATTQTGSMGYDQYTVPHSVDIEPTVFVFLALANVRQWPIVPFFQISLKNSELKTPTILFVDCRVHCFRQTFSN